MQDTECLLVSYVFDHLAGITGLHTQKAYTHTGTSSPQIPMLSAHAYMPFA